MNFVKKIIAVSLILFAFASPNVQAQDEPIVTVTTSFLYDMVGEIAGDTVQTELIIPAGSDPHLYQASANDINKIAEADVVIYHGLDFEGQMAEVLESFGHAVTRDFNEEDLILLCDENVVDPHFWFDINLYKQAVGTMKDILSEQYPDNAELYQTNTESYLAELDELATWVEETLEPLPEEQRILVTPHDAFGYLATAYQFEVIAPQGISTDSEVSNQAISETVNLMIEYQVPAIFVESTTNPETMEKLQEGAASQDYEVEVVQGEGQQLFSDSLAPEGQAGDTYIDMYKHNIQLIVDYLTQ